MRSWGRQRWRGGFRDVHFPLGIPRQLGSSKNPDSSSVIWRRRGHAETLCVPCVLPHPDHVPSTAPSSQASPDPVSCSVHSCVHAWHWAGATVPPLIWYFITTLQCFSFKCIRRHAMDVCGSLLVWWIEKAGTTFVVTAAKIIGDGDCYIIQIQLYVKNKPLV